MNGLNNEEIIDRISKKQVNSLSNYNTRPVKDIIFSNVFTYFNFINVILFVFVCSTGSFHNGAFFLTILFNDCICIFQEIKAKKIMDNMFILLLEDVETLRNGKWQKIKVNEIVLDDTIKVKTGMQVPVDGIILSGSIEVNEAILTGEAVPSLKKEKDEVLSGTIVCSGNAVIQATRVGKDTFSERILHDAKKYKKSKSQLNEEIDKLMKRISFLIVPIGIFLYFSQINTDLSRDQAILKTVSAIVGMIPEGLVVLISIALTMSTVRLSKKGVLVQDLYSIESLARVDTLCIDKTGTITNGKMHVVGLDSFGLKKEEISKIMSTYLFVMQDENATAMALKKYFGVKNNMQVINSCSFSSERKYSGIEMANGKSYYLGAYQFLTAEKNEMLEEKIQNHARKGHRVLALFQNDGQLFEEMGKNRCIALIYMEDELRDNIYNILSYFYQNDVDVKIISGDQAETVSTIALNAGVKNGENYINLRENAKPIHEIVEWNTVFGRVLPNEKKEIIASLQKKGHIVAMIGDGVNDVPALKQADVSISIDGASFAAKNTANIVLLHNDFKEMKEIVQEGRRVINNITRSATMFLVKTGFSLFISIYAILFREHYPFLPIHLTLIGMFAVAIPTFILQFEPSFERTKTSFLRQAFSYSIPSSIEICLFTILCNILQDLFLIPTMQMHTIVVSITFFVYLYTLKKVYSPLNKFRKGILICMFLFMAISMFLFQNLLQLDFSIKSFIAILVLALLIPLLFTFIQFFTNKIINRRK